MKVGDYYRDIDIEHPNATIFQVAKIDKITDTVYMRYITGNISGYRSDSGDGIFRFPCEDLGLTKIPNELLKKLSQKININLN